MPNAERESQIAARAAQLHSDSGQPKKVGQFISCLKIKNNLMKICSNCKKKKKLASSTAELCFTLWLLSWQKVVLFFCNYTNWSSHHSQGEYYDAIIYFAVYFVQLLLTFMRDGAESSILFSKNYVISLTFLANKVGFYFPLAENLFINCKFEN